MTLTYPSDQMLNQAYHFRRLPVPLACHIHQDLG